MSVEARLWLALREVEDPEIPISVVGMGLIVSLAYVEAERTVDIRGASRSCGARCGRARASARTRARRCAGWG